MQNQNEISKPDNNDIIYVTYEDMKFEVDVLGGNIILIDEFVLDMFLQKNIESLPVNLFFTELVKAYKRNKEV